MLYNGFMAYKDPLDERARASRRKHYEANKEQYYARNKLKQAQLRQHVLDIKNSTACSDCGTMYAGEPWLTEFDHVRGEKKYEIGKIFNRGSWRLLEEELAKCELVCLICHRRRTAERGNWKDNRDSHLL